MQILNITDMLPRGVVPYNRRTVAPSVIVIHHSETRADVTPEDIAKYHVYSNHWPGIGYHFLVYANGRVNQVNDIMTLSYHAGDGTDSPLNTNRFGVGVCLVGDFNHTNPPEAQLQATRELIANLGLPFIPHKEAYNTVTSCPGDTWDSWKNELKGEDAMCSKVTLHFQGMTSWAASAVAQYWQFPRWVKVMNPPVPDAFPGTFVLGRAWTRGDMNTWEAACVAKGTAGGAEYFNALLPYYAARRGIVTAWEAANEPDISDTTKAAKYRDYLDEWSRLMHSVGLKCCGGSISVGNPKLKAFDGSNEELKIIAPALARCDYWSYHGYWQRPYDPADNWWAGRYRLIVSECAAMGFTLPPLIISETGADIGGGHNDGWRVQYGGDWNAYFADIKRYSAELNKDAYVVAATFFTSGPNSDWGMFEIDQVQADALGQFVRDDVVVVLPVPHEGLPEDEPATDAKTIAEKSVWWCEEQQRQYEDGNVAYANRIRLSLIQLLIRARDIYAK